MKRRSIRVRVGNLLADLAGVKEAIPENWEIPGFDRFGFAFGASIGITHSM